MGRDDAWQEVDWRSHLRWVSVRGEPANVLDLGGRGKPVVFVHGLGGRWTNWLPNLMAFRAAGHRVVAVDLPGFGHSPMPSWKITISAYGDWLEDLFDQLAIDRACVVGNSMGGFIAAEAAIAHASRVERLVLVAAAGITIEHQRNDRLQAALERAEVLIAAQGAAVARRARWLVTRPGLRKAMLAIVTPDGDRWDPDLAMEQILGTGKPGFLPSLDALTHYPIRERLGEIDCPTLIVWGTEDRLVPVRDADVFEQMIPGARKVVWDGIGHVPQLEVPDRFNALVAEFLAQEPGAAPADEQVETAA